MKNLFVSKDGEDSLFFRKCGFVKRWRNSRDGVWAVRFIKLKKTPNKIGRLKAIELLTAQSITFGLIPLPPQDRTEIAKDLMDEMEKRLPELAMTDSTFLVDGCSDTPKDDWITKRCCAIIFA